MEKLFYGFEQGNERLTFTLEDKLINEWKRLYPESFEMKVEDQKREKDKLHSIEDHIRDQEVVSLLKDYGIDDVEIRELDNGIYAIPVVEHFMDRRLPEGYGYKGGAARSLLRRNLRIDLRSNPRDIDIIRLIAEEPWEDADNELAKEFMPNDFMHGAGVETVLDENEYFATRDFTINEIMATDEEIRLTKQCLLDTVRNITRVARYEVQQWGGSAGPKMLSKALRFYAESLHRYGYVEMHENFDYEKYFISPFWLALQLDRAYEQSQELAQSYVDLLVLLNQLPQDIKTIEQAAKHLLDLMGDDSFYFRYAPTKQFETEERWLQLEEIYDK